MTKKAVQIRYNGLVFSDKVITDVLTSRTPCPTVSITTNANRDIDNALLYETNSITLDGIILCSGGTADLVKSYSGVVNFFNDPKKQNGLFEIVCGNDNNGTFVPDPNGFLQYSGTNFVSATADKSNNNWYITIPYTIVLESVSNKDPDGILIESYDDSWNIEPLEEISYYNLRVNDLQLYDIKQNVTYGQPGGNDPGVGVLRHNSGPSAQLLSLVTSRSNAIESHLQYRITHRVSAVGRPTRKVNPLNPQENNSVITNNNQISAYQNASNWVYRRLTDAVKTNTANSISYPNPTGVMLNKKLHVNLTTALSNQGNTNTMGLFLYNHIRTIESSPSAGSYGITDTWLALGTGVAYTEDFTWEISTDDKWVHTITMNGTIKGLETTPDNGYTLMSGYKDPITSTYKPALTGVIRGAEPGQIELISSKFSHQTIGSSKYENALAAYISGIKPYLYVRANHALNNAKIPPIEDNTAAQLSPYTTYKRTWFGPHIRPLNIVPVSFNETYNPAGGQITYTASYNDRPACLLSGALDASVSITDTNSVDLLAEAFILGRPLGPILEKVGSSKSERQLTIEALYPMPTGFNMLHPQSPQCVIYHRSNPNDSSTEYKAINNLVDAFKPVGAAAFSTFGSTSPFYLSLEGQIFKTLDNETWNPFEGRYTRNITWVYNTGTCT